MTDWLEEVIREDLFCLVAVEKGRVVGYFALEPYDYGERDVYPYVGMLDSHPARQEQNLIGLIAQIVVFIEPARRRRKIGELLYRAALAHPNIAKRGLKTIIGDVTSTNSASLNAALKAGFRMQVNINRLECKFGEWLDSCWVVKKLDQQPGSRLK